MELEEIFFENQRGFITKKGREIKPQPIGKPFIVVLTPEIVSTPTGGRYSDEILNRIVSQEILGLHQDEKGDYSKVNGFLVGQEESFRHSKFYAIQAYKI